MSGLGAGSSGPGRDEDEDEGEAARAEDPRHPGGHPAGAIANTVALHPSRDILVCGDVDGDVYAYSYSCTEGENRELWSSGHHMKSCRQVRFSADGLKLVSVSRDKAATSWTRSGDSWSPGSAARTVLQSTVCCWVDETSWRPETTEEPSSVGHEEGTAIMDLKHHEITSVTSLWTRARDPTLLPAAMYHGVFNIKRRRFELLSEYQSGDLTSVTLMKRGKKVVCGSSEGTIYIFNWNALEPPATASPSKQSRWKCIVPITDNTCAPPPWTYIRYPHDLNEYRKRKKKDGRMKSLTKKAHGDNDFFSGLVEETEKKEDEDEEEGRR
ncbi:WD repeat-containing protein 55 [Nibea albiflora]|uniref:WD repeat-containing protein 55 n=1 Tax=Nibea albiflora TaxID=240163 RepID=A0ACB7EUJ8_NIBAL|nr:WD repeat-containing protein 55 [Nibea albiflora]